jgi:hypothetical protein
MALHRRNCLTITAEALHPGTTVRYHYRTGISLATVAKRTDGLVTFVGEGCDGIFTHSQIDRLFADGSLSNRTIRGCAQSVSTSPRYADSASAGRFLHCPKQNIYSGHE